MSSNIFYATLRKLIGSVLRTVVVGTVGLALAFAMSSDARPAQAEAVNIAHNGQAASTSSISREASQFRPDIGDKPSFLNGAEWDAYVRKMRGLPYNKSYYKSAKKKFDKHAKESGQRNAQKRANNKKEDNNPNKHAYVVKAKWDKKEIVSFVVVVAGTLIVGMVFTGAGFVYAVTQTKNM